MDSANSTEKTINSGALIPIQDYISAEKTPNLWRQYGDYMNMMKNAEGNIFVLPNYGMYYNEYVQTSYNGPAFWIQKQLLIDMNYPKISTLDEYFDVLKAYKDKNPTINGQPTVGYEVLSFDWRAFCLKNAPAQLTGNPNDGGVIVDNTSGIASLYANTDVAKQYYSKLNEAYNDGLIMADTFVQNYDEYLARLSSGSVLGMYDQGWNFQTAADSLVSQGLDQLTWVPLGITFDKSITPWYRDRPIPNYNRGIGVTVDCKDPERYIQMIETLLSDKWQKIFTWGIEGEDYMVDDKGMFYRTPEQRTNAEDTNWKLANRAEAIFNSLPKMQGTFDDGNSIDPNSQASEYFEKLKEVDKQILQAYGFNYYSEFLGEAPENRKDYPAWQISLGDGTDAAIADSKISELQMKYLPQLILGAVSEFDPDWSDYVKEYDKVNVQAYIDRVNEGLKERRDKW
jgi:putative aldouronate transport system substrate-binding protein